MALVTPITETLEGAVRIVSGAAREVWGRVVNDGAMIAGGRVEQVSGQASLACVRARGIRGRHLPPG